MTELSIFNLLFTSCHTSLTHDLYCWSFHRFTPGLGAIGVTFPSWGALAVSRLYWDSTCLPGAAPRFLPWTWALAKITLYFSPPTLGRWNISLLLFHFLHCSASSWPQWLIGPNIPAEIRKSRLGTSMRRKTGFCLADSSLSHLLVGKGCSWSLQGHLYSERATWICAHQRTAPSSMLGRFIAVTGLQSNVLAGSVNCTMVKTASY